MIFGFENGMLLIYKQDDVHFFMILNPLTKEKVTCIDFLGDNSKMIAGYSKGTVCLYDFKTGTLLRKESVMNGCIIFIKFLKVTAKKISFAIGSSEDKIMRVKWIEKKMITKKMKNQNPVPENLNFYFAITQLQNALPFIYEEENNIKIKLLAIAMKQKVLVVDLKNLKEIVFELDKPSFLNKECVPFIFWDETSSLSKITT